MKALPSGLAAHIAGEVTSLCQCWRVALLDGSVLGFTDHDKPLSFDGVTYEPATGFAAAEVGSALGMSVDTQDVAGALSSDRIREDDLAAGLWDGAEVVTYMVDWSDIANRILLHRASIGEVTRGETAFRAELRGLAHGLAAEQGRAFQRQCDAVVGDSRCGVSLVGSFAGTGSVTGLQGTRTVTVSGLASYDRGWFIGGVLTWSSGANAGRTVEVRRHDRSGSIATIELWQPMSKPIEVGNTFTVSAGCDKTVTTCKSKFSNVVNFRGFPHIPGNDFSLNVARRNDSENDGGSMFR